MADEAESLAYRVRCEVPHLGDAEAADLVRIVDTLARTFQPQRIYLFGSHARGTPNANSDVDLLVVVEDAGQYPHQLDQAAQRAVGNRLQPLDVLFMSADEFGRRSHVVTSLPATVAREGRVLYAA